jgi:hypothetical protein
LETFSYVVRPTRRARPSWQRTSHYGKEHLLPSLAAPRLVQANRRFQIYPRPIPGPVDAIHILQEAFPEPGQSHFKIGEEFVLKGYGFSRALKSCKENSRP